MRDTRRVIHVTLISVLFIIASALAHAQTVTQDPDRRVCVMTYQDAFWIGTPRGLHAYRGSENVWSVRSTQNGLPSDAVTTLAVDQDIVWIGRRDGVTRYDPRANTLLSYDSGDGIPAGTVLCFAAEEDYAWIGTEGGAARYDKLIEQWQTVGAAQGLRGGAVRAISVREGRVFLMTDEAVNEYDPRYERWRAYAWSDSAGSGNAGSGNAGSGNAGSGNDSARALRDIFVAGGNAWMLRERDLIRFDFVSLSFQRYALDGVTGRDIRQIVIEGGSCWLVARSGMWYYDTQADAFRPFLELSVLPDRDLFGVAFSTDGASIWVATRQAISIFDRQEKTWSFLAASGGPSADELHALFSPGGELMALLPDRISTYRPTEKLWFTHALPEADAAGAVRPFSLDPSEGSYLRLGGDRQFSLSGSRFTWLGNGYGGTKYPTNEYYSYHHIDLKARLDLGGDRSVTATYNDVDYGDVMYGVQYRGARDDAVQSLLWGDARVEQGFRSLLSSFGVFGGGGRVTLGAKTDRYHRSLLDVSAVGGHRTTALATDVFIGRNRRDSSSLRDVDYIRRRCFALPEAPAGWSSLEVFRTLSRAEIDDPNALPDTVVAGIAGRWIALHPGLNYTLVDDARTLLLASEFPVDLGLAARFRGSDGRILAEVALSDSAGPSLALRNRYTVRGGVIPASLRVEILDGSGASLPLAQFGLDGNGDGRVDERYVDCKNGVLRFPAEEPFPASVYADPPASVYTIRVTCESLLSSYALAHANLERGSEAITVDGAAVRAGDDYVLDYTTGRLLFTRDGIVNDDSRIEVRYEYISHDTEDRYLQAAAVLSPSDNAQLSVAAGTFTPEGRTETATFLHTAGELRLQSGGIDARIAPEYSRSVSGAVSGNAWAVSSAVSAGPARVTWRSEQNDASYRRKFLRRFAFGELLDEHALQSELDLGSAWRLSAQWTRRSGRDTLTGSAASDEVLSGGLRIRYPAWPSVTLKAERIQDQTSLAGHDRRGARADIEYIAGPDALALLGFSSLTAVSYARSAVEDETPAGGTARSYLTQNLYLRVAASPQPLFTVNSWYRGDIREQADGGGSFQPYSVREKLFVDVVLESIRGVSLGLRHTGDAATFARRGDGTSDVDRRPSLQLSSRFSPGLLLPFLSPVTLEVNARYDASGYDAGAPGGRTLGASLISSGGGTRIYASDTRTGELRCEWRPAADVVYLGTVRLTRSSAGLDPAPDVVNQTELVQRLDLRNGSTGLYSAQVSVSRADRQWRTSTSTSPVFWAEQRWSPVFLTRLTFTTSFWSMWTDTYHSYSTDLSPAANVTISLQDLPVLRHAELRGDLAWARATSGWTSATSGGDPDLLLFKNTVTAMLSVDLFPHACATIRFQYTQQWYLATDVGDPMRSGTGMLQAVLQL